MKLSQLAIIAASAALMPTVASAQGAATTSAQPAIAAGAIIYDPQGAKVGTITSIAADSAVLDTGTSKATLPKSAFGTSGKGLTVNATRSQIDALVAASSARTRSALEAAFVPGAEVRGKAGAVIGKIKAVDGDHIVVDRTEGGPVSLNKTAFVLGSSGLTISLTADELAAAARTAPS